MNTRILAEAITNIRDEYVLEYDPADADLMTHSPKRPVWKNRWLQIAACFIAVLAIATVLPHMLKKAGNEFKMESFASYEQFAEAFTDADLIKNLKESNEYELEYLGSCELNNKSHRSGEYDTFMVVLRSKDLVVAEITIEPNGKEETIKNTVENHSLTKVLSIDNTAVNYGLNEDEDCWEAVFRYNEDNYSLLFYHNSETALVKLLHNLLIIK